jgi:hypothetical protein
MVSISFDFLSSKKTAPSLKRVKQNFFKIGHKGYQKKQNFALISKMCRTHASRSSQKQFFAKFFESHILKSAQILLLLIPCTPNFFPALRRGYKGLPFSEDKTLFYKLA